MNLSNSFRELLNESTYLVFQFLSSYSDEVRKDTKIISYLKKIDNYSKKISSFKNFSDAEEYTLSILKQCKAEVKDAYQVLQVFFVNEASSFIPESLKFRDKKIKTSYIVGEIKKSLHNEENDIISDVEFKGNVLEKIKALCNKIQEFNAINAGYSNEEDYKEYTDDSKTKTVPLDDYDPAPLPEELPDMFGSKSSRYGSPPNSPKDLKRDEMNYKERIAELERQLNKTREENRILKEKIRIITKLALEGKAIIG